MNLVCGAGSAVEPKDGQREPISVELGGDQRPKIQRKYAGELRAENQWRSDRDFASNRMSTELSRNSKNRQGKFLLGE